MCSKLRVSALFGAFLFGQAAMVLANDSDSQARSAPAKTSETTAPTGPKLFEVERQMIEQTNAQRAKYGLPPLLIDQSLENTARSHTIWMTNNRALQHSTANIGENIAMGQQTTSEAVTDWMNSPGHRANILNSSYKRTGVAAYRTPDGTIYWCQQFLP
ncbi:MAG TPA: CAP domain-containing protein [Pirellulales bacterium]|nr:CAP domain-containing protein [Pirellulales bacterium]